MYLFTIGFIMHLKIGIKKYLWLILFAPILMPFRLGSIIAELLDLSIESERQLKIKK